MLSTVAIGYSQIVDIPDANFKNALLSDPLINTNLDNEIQVSEANTYEGVYLNGHGTRNTLILNNSSIEDLTGIKSFTQIKNLDVGSNNLTSLDVSKMNNLEGIFCDGNNLTSLNISYLKLKELDCTNNQLTNIDLSNVSQLDSLDCSYNFLTTLDLSSIKTIYEIRLTDNLLETLYIKNGFSESYYYLQLYDNNNLKYICCDQGEESLIYDELISYNLDTSNIEVNSYCPYTFNGKTHLAEGTTKIDINNDGCDENDNSIQPIKYSITGGIETRTLLIPEQDYSIGFSNGTYTITPSLTNYTANPTSKTVEFTSNSTPVIQDFCFTPTTTINDLELTLIPTNAARPGFDAEYRIVATNKGTTTLNGEITFAFDPSVSTYTSSSPSFSTSENGKLHWNFTNLIPFESVVTNVVLTLNTPTDNPALLGGETIQLNAFSTIANDATPENNNILIDQTVVNSYDPNDKTCLQGDTINESMIGEYVDYLIRFENTGTASAVHVVVKDSILPEYFDISNVQISDASHPMRTEVNGNIIEFIFKNIELPFDDANNDGYVAFKIKTKATLQLGDVIENVANIYFDYNPAIETNIAKTKIAEKNELITATANSLNTNAIDIYPSPATDQTTVSSNTPIQQVSLYNSQGQLVRNIQ